jgi:ABC-type glycerol-3-phosphate transport system substrate-binding protein
MSRLTLLAATLALLLLAAGCSGGKTAESQDPSSTSSAPATGPTATGRAPNPRQLTDLHDIAQLRSLFNARSGEPRLILLVSPT